MKRRDVLGQLYVMRAQLDVLIQALEPQAETPKGCTHPEEKRIEAGTMEHPHRFICGLCEAEFDERVTA